MTLEQVITVINFNKDNRLKEGKRSYDTKSQKDEIEVMKALMNDTSYQVDVYNNNGYQGTYNPARAIRNTISNVIANTTGISKIEADNLLLSYEFKNNEAKDMIDFGKEFLNTYLFKTKRKLSLGGREKSNVSLKAKTVPEGYVKYPVKLDNNKCGFKEVHIPEYDSIVVYGPCPNWRHRKDGDT